MTSRSFLFAGLATLALASTPLSAVADVVVNGQVQNLTGDDAAKPVAVIGNNAADVPINGVTAPIVYRDFRQQLTASNGANPAKAADVQSSGQLAVDAMHTGNRIIGAWLKDATGAVAGQVEDVTFDQRGNAQKLLVRDAGFFGSGGKLVALDYKALDRDQADGGDTFIPVDKNIAQTAAVYEKSADTGALHLTDLRGANLKSPTQETLGHVDDVIISGGQAVQLVLSFDLQLGLGGEKTVMSFADAGIVNKGSGTFVQLTAHQADTLRILKTGK